MHDISNLQTAKNYKAVANPRLVSAPYISELFGKPADWFSRDRVRKALYARGFPRPVIRGRWLRSAIDSWLERKGTQTRVSPNGRLANGR